MILSLLLSLDPDVALLKDWLMAVTGILLVAACFLVAARAVLGESDEDQGRVKPGFKRQP